MPGFWSNLKDTPPSNYLHAFLYYIPRSFKASTVRLALDKDDLHYDGPVAHKDDNGRHHSLNDHLYGTAKMAAEMAREFGCDEWGRIAGLYMIWER